MFFGIDTDDGNTAVSLHNFDRQLVGALLGMSGWHIKPYAERTKHSSQYCLLKPFGFGCAFLATGARQNEGPAQSVSQDVLLAQWRCGGPAVNAKPNWRVDLGWLHIRSQILQERRSSSGSLAMFTAIRRASSDGAASAMA